MKDTKAMTDLHNPSHPRHARIFELLRQTHQAEHVIRRIKRTSVRELDEQTARKIKDDAYQSLRLHAVDRGAVTGPL